MQWRPSQSSARLQTSQLLQVLKGQVKQLSVKIQPPQLETRALIHRESLSTGGQSSSDHRTSSGWVHRLLGGTEHGWTNSVLKLMSFRYKTEGCFHESVNRMVCKRAIIYYKLLALSFLHCSWAYHIMLLRKKMWKAFLKIQNQKYTRQARKRHFKMPRETYGDKVILSWSKWKLYINIQKFNLFLLKHHLVNYKATPSCPIDPNLMTTTGCSHLISLVALHQCTSYYGICYHFPF